MDNSCKPIRHAVRFGLAAWLALIMVILAAAGSGTPQAHAACTMQNPIVSPGQDPSIWYANGLYYLVQSDGTSIWIRASTNLGGLGSAQNTRIWTAPAGTEYSTQVWAPELENLNGRWIIYFAAARDMGSFDATNNTHRIYAITANSGNPLGSWSFFGRVQDPTNEWAIDPTVFYYNNNWYLLWSGTPPGNGGNAPQQIYIAHMSDPLHVDEPYRKLIANPDQSWEISVQAIEEGPEAFIGPNNTLTIVYSANASWTSSYNLGELVYHGGDMGYYASYTKIGPVFSSGGGVYGPGHNSLPVPGPNGKNWLVYHAKSSASDGWDDRKIFAQPQTWNSDGTPTFGGGPKGYTSFDETTQQPC
ncbi:family 43 glycosylhydrolase [Ktedonospora formicarum]|uniref:Glycosyl hydrolase family 43 n=1 Tax=Ktedonospora formicarum TaxID=2778364 RepID=A0A8J3IBY7_9CHLR|nr:glycoside hydrolase family 43 protein [Ktedonospora formicarum]GHO49279.1 glycosyl hydrolase family 43 [Ktedonospora formicarum]